MPSNSSLNKIPVIHLSNQFVASLHPREYGADRIETAIVGLEQILGDKIAQAKSNLQAVKERAIYHYQTAPAQRSDDFFMERVLCKAIEDVSNKGGLGLFRFSFDIDGLLMDASV